MPEADCNEAIHALYHFLDGELASDVRHKIQRHLEECPPCFEAFDFEAELRLVIARKCRDQPPIDLRRRIVQAIHYESRYTMLPRPMGGDPFGPRGIDPI